MLPRDNWQRFWSFCSRQSQNEVQPSFPQWRQKRCCCIRSPSGPLWPLACPQAPEVWAFSGVWGVQFVKWIIHVSLLASMFWVQKGNLLWCLQTWQWVSPHPGLVSMVPRAHRCFPICNILPCCPQLLHFGQSNSSFPDWHLNNYLWFILPQLIFLQSSSLLSWLTGWYLPYILQITHCGLHPLWGLPGAQVIKRHFYLRAF